MYLQRLILDRVRSLGMNNIHVEPVYANSPIFLYFPLKGTSETFANHWKLLRSFQPKGPLMNSEYYPGWFTHWQEKAGKVDANVVADSFR